jgi:Ca2+-binding RTX toxin-like protein
VTDDDGGTADTSQALPVSAVEVQADPADPTGSVLAVGGTLGKDHVDLLPGAEAGTIEVLIDDVPQGTYSGVSGVIVYGQAGDDFVHVGDVTVPVTFYGGAGNDKLHTTRFSDVLIGGEGDDRVVGRGPAEKQG